MEKRKEGSKKKGMGSPCRNRFGKERRKKKGVEVEQGGTYTRGAGKTQREGERNRSIKQVKGFISLGQLKPGKTSDGRERKRDT